VNPPQSGEAAGSRIIDVALAEVASLPGHDLLPRGRYRERKHVEEAGFVEKMLCQRLAAIPCS